MCQRGVLSRSTSVPFPRPPAYASRLGLFWLPWLTTAASGSCRQNRAAAIVAHHKSSAIYQRPSEDSSNADHPAPSQKLAPLGAADVFEQRVSDSVLQCCFAPCIHDLRDAHLLVGS